jgi:hypothetical protein
MCFSCDKNLWKVISRPFTELVTDLKIKNDRSLAIFLQLDDNLFAPECQTDLRPSILLGQDPTDFSGQGGTMKFRSLLIFLFFPFLVSAQSFVDTRTALGRAQQAYVSGNLKIMALNLRQALEQNPQDSVVKANALSLLAKAYENAGDAGIPVDWHLPDEIKFMDVGVKYTVRDEGRYLLRVYGQTQHEHSVQQLQIIQFPDRVILDKKAGIGSWSDQQKIDSAGFSFELASDRSRQMIPGGLYLLNMTLNDGTQTRGWFIIEDTANSTAAPRILSPAMDEVFHTPNPTFHWQNFVSPQYQPFERRSLWLGISRSEPPDYKWDEVYGHYEAPPVVENWTINANGDDNSLPNLSKGGYIFLIDYHERKKFGDLKITRDSVSSRSFRVN